MLQPEVFLRCGPAAAQSLRGLPRLAATGAHQRSSLLKQRPVADQAMVGAAAVDAGHSILVTEKLGSAGQTLHRLVTSSHLCTDAPDALQALRS